MQYIEPPPAPRPDKEKPSKKIRKIKKNGTDASQIVIEKAQVRDVEEILELVNTFAASNLMLPRGPQYLYENIRDFVIVRDQNASVYDMTEARELLHPIVACGSMHVLWKDIAEIRSLAIQPGYQHLGLGSKIVDYMKKEAKKLDIKQLFTFTLTENFFKKLGFKKISRENFPPKVWGECSRCPKYFNCDEVGMILDLEPK